MRLKGFTPFIRAAHTASNICPAAPEPAHRRFPYIGILNAQLERHDNVLQIEIRALLLEGQAGMAVVSGVIDDERAQAAEIWVHELMYKSYGMSSNFPIILDVSS